MRRTIRERRDPENRRKGPPRRREDRVFHALNQLRGWAGVLFIALGFWLLNGVANDAHDAAHQAKRGLAYYEAFANQRRADQHHDLIRLRHETAANRRLALANRRLALRVERLAAQRIADNSRQLATVAADEQRIASLQQQQASSSARNEYDACVQVEAVKRGLRLNFHILIPRPERLPPPQRRLIERLESQFAAHHCTRP